MDISQRKCWLIVHDTGPLTLFCVFFRLHEFDEQVSAVREGMARVVPVPLLSLFTGYELETMVSENWLCYRELPSGFWLARLPHFFLYSGVRKPGHPSPPAEVSCYVQGGGADIGAHPVVLGGDGVLLQHGEVAFPEIRLGTHAASPHHRRLPWAGFCCAGEKKF